jgi:hypothetical protein
MIRWLVLAIALFALSKAPRAETLLPLDGLQADVATLALAYDIDIIAEEV